MRSCRKCTCALYVGKQFPPIWKLQTSGTASLTGRHTNWTQAQALQQPPVGTEDLSSWERSSQEGRSMLHCDSLCSRENHLFHGKKRTTSRILWASWRTLWSTDQRRTGEVSGFTTLKQRIPPLPCHRRPKQCPLPWGWVATPLTGGFLWERKSARWFCTPDGYIARRLNRWDQPTWGDPTTSSAAIQTSLPWWLMWNTVNVLSDHGWWIR